MDKNSLLEKVEDADISVQDLDLEGEFLAVDKELNEYTFGEYAVILAMALLLCSVSVTVLGRMLFKIGVRWTEEFGRLMLVCVAFLGLGVAYKENMHFKVDKIIGIPEKVYWVLDIFSCLVEIGIMLLLLIKGLEMMWMTRTDITASLNMPVAIFYSPLPLGAIGMAFHSTKKLLSVLKGGRVNE